MAGAVRTLAAGAISAAATIGARHLLDRLAPGGTEKWIRTNHRGEPISLMEGPAVVVGAAVGAAIAGSSDAAQRSAQAIAALGAGAFGLYDDLEEDTSVRSKGLKGHIGALAQGTVTTGGLKVLGIGVSALVASGLSAKARSKFRLSEVVLDTVVIAGAANLGNLLDLRPGRALKVATATGGANMLMGSPAGAAVIGSSAAAFPEDLAEKGMLGDCGANALGALVGTSFVQSASVPARLTGAAVIVGLTLASEKVSFSKVIAENKVLNRIDMLGRRPVHVESRDLGETGLRDEDGVEGLDS